MKKLFNLFLVGVLCFGLTACSQNEADKDNIDLGNDVVDNNEEDKVDLGNNVINEMNVTFVRTKDGYDHYYVNINVSNSEGIRNVSCGYVEYFDTFAMDGSGNIMNLVDGDNKNGKYFMEITLDVNANKDNVDFVINILDSSGYYTLEIPYNELVINE